MSEPIEERDGQEIALEVYAEMDKAETGEPRTLKPESTPKKDDEQAGETDDKSKEQAKGATEDGEGAEGSKKADEKPPEGETEGGDKDDLDKKVTEYAQKHGMTYVEAKEDIEKTEEILKQFKNDPAEMARAMRNKDREYHKLKAEAEKAQAKKEPVFERLSDDQFRAYAKEKIAAKPEIIANFRKTFPAKSEYMSDEAIIEESVEHALKDYQGKAAAKESEIKTSASKKRETLLASVPESDRRFIPDIKALLYETDDRSVLSEGFDIKDAMQWAKGKTYDADIKAAEERGEKRAREGAKIIGVKTGGSTSKPAGDKKSTLNAAQKKYAVEMFGADSPDEKCYTMFQETYADELKNNTNFDPYKD